MMKTLFSIFATFIITTVYSQTVSYDVLSNDPPKTPRLSINTDLTHLELIPGSIDAMSMNASVWGFYEILPERVGTQFLLRRSWFAFGRLGEKKFPSHNELELGGYYVLNSALKTKKTKVTLKKEYSGTTYSTNYNGDIISSRTETETFLLIPSKKKKLFMVRGGLYRKSHGNINFIDDLEFIKVTTGGIYAGLNFRTLTSIFIDTKEYGVQYNSLGRDVYLDVLYLPINRFHNLDGDDITKNIRQSEKSGPFGFRVGYKLFQIDKRAKTGKMFGLCGNFEAGIRPFTGYFISSGIGITFVK